MSKKKNGKKYLTTREIQAKFINYRFKCPLVQSPSEDIFWGIAKDMVPGLLPQHKFRYRVQGKNKFFQFDFAILRSKVAVELDGYKFHNPLYDYFKDVFLESLGWKVIRFAGFQISDNLEKCVRYLLDFLNDKIVKDLGFLNNTVVNLKN